MLSQQQSKIKTTVYILEISSFQLDIMHDLKFDIAACANITPDHLDRYGNMQNYVQSKERIFNIFANPFLEYRLTSCS